MTGNAWGDVQLVGPLGEMDLLGQLTVDGRATVTALGTTYTLQQDTVRFVRNDILLDSVPVQDRYQQTAYLKGGIHHDHLSALTFDLDVTTDKFLAYDLLNGRPGEVVINCNATPLPQSTFTYNAASADAISQQEFITWKEKAQHASSPTPFQSKAAGEAGDETPSDLYMNLTVNATPDAQVRLLMDPRTGDYITLYGSGIIARHLPRQRRLPDVRQLQRESRHLRTSPSRTSSRRTSPSRGRHHRLRRRPLGRCPEPAGTLHRQRRVAQRPGYRQLVHQQHRPRELPDEHSRQAGRLKWNSTSTCPP